MASKQSLQTPGFKKVRRKQEKRATSDDIQDIAGPLDNAIVMAILHTGATRTEIQLAFESLEENHYTKATFARPIDERVRHVYDILDYAGNGHSGKKH